MSRSHHAVAAALAALLLLAGAAPGEDLVVGSIPDGPPVSLFAPPSGSSVEACHQFPAAAFGPSGRFVLRGRVALTGFAPFGPTGDVVFRLRAGGSATAEARTSDVDPLQVLFEVKVTDIVQEALSAFPSWADFEFESGETVTLPAGGDIVQACVQSFFEGAGIPIWHAPGTTVLGRDGADDRLLEFPGGQIGLELVVKPTVDGDGLVRTTLVPQVANLRLPSVEWHTATTALAVGDGATVTIGGILRDTDEEAQVPVLGEVPILGGLFKKVEGYDGAGTLLIFITPHIVRDDQARAASIPFAANLAVQSTITATLPDGRQFGQLLNGRPAEEAQPAGTTAVLFTTHDPARYRVNLGVAAAREGTVVRLTPLDASGAALAPAHAVNLPLVGSNTQINDVFSFFGLADTPNAVVEVEVISGSAFSYSSAVDGRAPGMGTSDPTTQLPARGGAERVTLLEVGRVQGIDEFSGSAMLHNHDDRTAAIVATFTPRGTRVPAANVNISLPARHTLGWDDVVGDLFSRTGEVGTVVFAVTNGARISALGREFAILRDGQGAVTGTAGQLMPGLGDADALQPGATAHLLGLREGGGERSHLAVFNPGPGTVTVDVASFGAGGDGRGSLQRSVRSGELLRLNSVLLALEGGYDGGERRLEVTATGPAHLLGYRVNATGDPVTLLPFLE